MGKDGHEGERERTKRTAQYRQDTRRDGVEGEQMLLANANTALSIIIEKQAGWVSTLQANLQSGLENKKAKMDTQLSWSCFCFPSRWQTGGHPVMCTPAAN